MKRPSAPRAAPKNTPGKPVDKPVAGSLVQGRNGGRIRHGSQPGTNAPGPGRPPSELRERLRGSFDERVQVLEEIADREDASPSDRIRAIDLLAKYGLGALQGVPDEVVQSKLAATIDIIEATVPEEIQPNLLAQLQAVWDGQ
jgi:hypothetical protein